ncbi:MAG: hypothetical protein PHX95_08355 [Lachnospiraceae bacterium]|jgi:hypothetical protein|nr:hypothetical protein [Lachnospiraceae bacterium]
MDLENKIIKTFDYQRFSPNKHLAGLIAETNQRYGLSGADLEINDDDMLEVSAAGDQNLLKFKLKKGKTE